MADTQKNAGKLHSAKEQLTEKQQELGSKEDVTEGDLVRLVQLSNASSPRTHIYRSVIRTPCV